MCCIFTCCGWFLDLINRAITFTMSCTIVAAAVCAFLVAGTAGIALGYNYSIHEYMDLRETGVQTHDHVLTKLRENPEGPHRMRVRGRKMKQETRVDIKLRRGIFDDDLQEDLDSARRSGELPPPAIKDGDIVRTLPEEGGPPPKSRRRLEDMVGEEPGRYESNLKRLTAAPVASNALPPDKADERHTTQEPLMPQPDQRSMDRLKAIQSLINSKKQNEIARRVGGDKIHNVYDTTPQLDERFFPPELLKEMPESARKAISQGKNPESPYRQAVPDYIDTQAWRRAAAVKGDIDPKLKQVWRDPMAGNAEDFSLAAMTYPPPVRLHMGPVRPTRPAGPPTRSDSPGPPERQAPQWPPATLPPEPSDRFNENRLLAKFDSRKKLMVDPPANDNGGRADYYDDPARRRGIQRGL